MPQGQVHLRFPTAGRVEISSFAHATEDAEKVIRAILEIGGGDISQRILTRRVKGHYGNRITICSLRLSDRSKVELFLRRLWAGLSKEDQSKIDNQIRQANDTGRLHLRFDKQEALGGRIILRDDDPIKIEILLRKTGKA